MLLERDNIVAQLGRLAGESLTGRGSVAFVVGEAGIGKTSVLRAVAERLADRLRLLWSACEDLSTAEALTLLRELSVVNGDALDHATDSGSRLALFGDTLERLAKFPTVLLIENLHWSDVGSIDFVRYIGRRIADLPLMLIVSSRNKDQGARGQRPAANDPPSLRPRPPVPSRRGQDGGGEGPDRFGTSRDDRRHPVARLRNACGGRHAFGLD